MSRPSKAELQEQVQLLKEAEGIVDQPEKVVLQDAAAIKHKLDQTAAEVGTTRAHSRLWAPVEPAGGSQLRQCVCVSWSAAGAEAVALCVGCCRSSSSRGMRRITSSATSRSHWGPSGAWTVPAAVGQTGLCWQLGLPRCVAFSC